MSEPSAAQVPNLAFWLLNLFTPPNQAEPISGDLLEEFTMLASTLGIRCARRWYWQQVVKTVAHLLVSTFRASPWIIAATALGGYLLLTWAVLLVEIATGEFLEKVQIYQYVNANLFWWIYAVAVERVICPMLAGWILAAIAKGREMAFTIILATVLGSLGVPISQGAGLLWLLYMAPNVSKIQHYLPHANLYLFVLNAFTLGLLPPIALLIGAVMRRKRVSSEQRVAA